MLATATVVVAQAAWPSHIRNPRQTAEGDGALTLAWDPPQRTGGSPIVGYGVQHRRDGAAWASEVPAGRDTSGTRTTHTVTGPTNGVTYHLRVTPWNQAKGCLPWSDQVGSSHASVSGTPQGAPTKPGPEPMVIAAPGPVTLISTNPSDADHADRCPARLTTQVSKDIHRQGTHVDVIPRQRRLASLCWAPVLGATTHVVEATDDLRDINSPTKKDWTPISGTSQLRPEANKPQHFLLDLDAIIKNMSNPKKPLGLAQRTAFGIRIEAKGQTNNYSKPIFITDTPIIRASGANGQAEITWKSVGRVVTRGFSNDFGTGSYELRYRASVSNHRAPGWTPDDFADMIFTHPTSEDVSDSGASETRTDVIDGVVRGPLYAVQLIYRDDTSTSNSNDADLFAARNAYVWPSTSSPSDTSGGYAITVGGMKLERRLTRQNTEYRICGDSFGPPGDRRRGKWEDLINEGFRQWASATGNLVSFNLVQGCATDPLSVRTGLDTMQRRNTYDTIMKHIQKQVMNYPTVTALRHIEDYVHQLRDTLMIGEASHGSVVSRLSDQSDRLYEVYMFDDMSLSTIRRTTIFANIATAIDYWDKCWFEGGAYQNPANMCHWPRTDAAGKVRASNIIIRRGAYDVGRGSDREGTSMPEDALQLPVYDARFNTCRNNYEGIATKDDTAYTAFLHEVGHLIGSASQPTSDGHPEIPDSVMNYDQNVVVEPDCAPHPIDSMAVFALYQNGF